MVAPADDQSKSATTTPYPPAPPHPPAPPYSQSYPTYPQPPYQAYPPPYSAYPNHPNAYYTTAPPPAAYYHNYMTPQHQPSAHVTFARFILTIMIILVIGSFTLSLLSWIIFGMAVPSFYIKTLTVPTFNVSGAALIAEWDVNVTVKNSNEKFDVFFERLEGVVVYDEMILALSVVQSFQVGPKAEEVFGIKLSTTNTRQESLVGDYQDLVRDRNNGEVVFALRLLATTKLRSGSMWQRKLRVKVACEDLQVKFGAPSGPGELVSGQREQENECLIFV